MSLICNEMKFIEIHPQKFDSRSIQCWDEAIKTLFEIWN